MKIPKDVIIMWDGAHASIPSGYTRDNTFNSRTIKDAGAGEPGGYGGAATHTHGSPGHSHVINTHTHI